jgi:hypothetical protein
VRKAHTYRVPTLEECNKDLKNACERAMFDIFVPDNVIFHSIIDDIDDEELLFWQVEARLS